MRRCLRATGRAMVQFSLLVHPDSIREFQQPRGFRHPLYWLSPRDSSTGPIGAERVLRSAPFPVFLDRKRRLLLMDTEGEKQKRRANV